MSEQKVLYKIKVYGRVQGVGFRYACQKEARFRGLSGFVKNMQDGSVYIEAEGNPDQLSELVAWCRRGPGFGSVDDITVETGNPFNYRSFSIKYA